MNNQEQKIDPETKRILDIFKYHLEPKEFKEWWEVEKQAKKEAQDNLRKMIEMEKQEWGEVKVFAKKKTKEEEENV